MADECGWSPREGGPPFGSRYRWTYVGSRTDNIELTAEALNLTDEFQDQFVDADANRLSYYHHQGRQYMVGARFKFYHPPTLFDEDELGRGRMALALAALLVLVVCFTPVPITF